MVGLATSVLVLLELQHQVDEGGLLQAVKGSAPGPSIENSGTCLACCWLTFPVGLKVSEE